MFNSINSIRINFKESYLTNVIKRERTLLETKDKPKRRFELRTSGSLYLKYMKYLKEY